MFYPKSSLVWFTLYVLGHPYQLDLSKNEFKRLDDTYYKGHNFGTAQIVRKDSLYSFGGYGFWAYSKVLNYYEYEAKEWQILRIGDDRPKAIMLGYQGYSNKVDKFFSGGAEFISQEKNSKKEYLDKLFEFDFKTSKWSKLGKINPNLPFKIYRTIFWDGQFFIHWAADKLYLIDPVANKVSVVADLKKNLPYRHFKFLQFRRYHILLLG